MAVTKVLVVQTAFIGDVILITPLIRAIKQLYPDAVLDVMVVPAAAKLLQNNPHVREVIPFAKRKNALVSMLKMVSFLRGKAYDLVVSPHSSGRTHLLLWLSGIPMRIGFDRSILPRLLTHKIKHPNDMHKINKNLRLLKFLSSQDFPMQTELFPSEQDIKTAEALLQSAGSAKLIAIAPGSIWATKCWPLEYFAELTTRLAGLGYALVLIGAEADKAKCDGVEQAIRQTASMAPVINLAGKTNLLESAAVIGKCELMICNDSGALHIANAMQTRVFAMFGPTVQRIGYYPYRSEDRVFEVELVCRPCGSHGGNKCPLGHHNCMRQLSVDSILNAIIEKCK